MAGAGSAAVRPPPSSPRSSPLQQRPQPGGPRLLRDPLPWRQLQLWASAAVAPRPCLPAVSRCPRASTAPCRGQARCRCSRQDSTKGRPPGWRHAAQTAAAAFLENPWQGLAHCCRQPPRWCRLPSLQRLQHLVWGARRQQEEKGADPWQVQPSLPHLSRRRRGSSRCPRACSSGCLHPAPGASGSSSRARPRRGRLRQHGSAGSSASAHQRAEQLPRRERCMRHVEPPGRLRRHSVH